MLFFEISLALSALLTGSLLWACRSRGYLIQRLRKSEDQLATAQRDIARLTRELDQCKSRYAHDLRSPLQTVMGYADLLSAETTGPLNAKQRRFLDTLREGTHKLLQIIEGKPVKKGELERQGR